MKVTMMGIGGTYPGPGETGSGFLVQHGSTNLLVDCGNGVIGILQEFISLPEVTDIYISHMHADHFFDLIPFRYALYYGYENMVARKPRLYLPPEGITVLNQVVDYFADTGTFFTDVFDVCEYEEEKTIKLADMEIKPSKVKHYIASYGVSITGDRRVAYSSDSGECDGLYEIAEKAELFICNVGNSLDTGRGNSWGHLNPEQAGALADKAGVQKMLVSHIPQGYKKEEYVKRAAVSYKGSLEAALARNAYEVS